MGNLFSFLIAHLVARREGGRLCMRVEDLDLARTKRSHAEGIMRDLAWFGFEWDDEVVWQSERTEAYREALAELERQGLVYPCFCSRADLHAANAPHFGDEVVYAGTCRSLSDEQRAERAAERSAALRVRVDDAPLSFCDLFQGKRSYDLSCTSGDFIIRRSDCVFAYQLAVVVDDAWMGVTSVVRGVDLLLSTPRQLYLQDKLGLPHPTYGHVPLIVDELGVRLAKRNEDASLSYLMDERKLSAGRILGRLAYCAGLVPEDGVWSLSELERHADLDALRMRDSVTWTAFER